jgi:2,4-dienoyl-CoA reductase (NADPH2)
VIAEGRITRPEIAERALSEGSCDLVGMTRAQIADPDLVRKAAEGRAAEIRECVALNVCVARRFKKFPIACVQNPQAGFETRPVRQSGDPRRVVVIGGGVAGLEAARAAAAAGHVVTLLERTDRLGGQVALIAELPFQQAHRSLIDWRVGELDRLGVDVEVGVDASADIVAGLEPDIAVVATGSEPDNRYAAAISAMDILRGADIQDGPVVVVDEEGHRKATGVAEALVAGGRQVTIVGDGVAPAALLGLALAAEPTLRRLDTAGVRLVANAHVAAVEPGRVHLRQGDGADEIAGVVVHAGRHRAVDGLVSALRAKGIEANAIGDARAPRLVEDAVRDGYEAVRVLR